MLFYDRKLVTTLKQKARKDGKQENGFNEKKNNEKTFRLGNATCV